MPYTAAPPSIRNARTSAITRAASFEPLTRSFFALYFAILSPFPDHSMLSCSLRLSVGTPVAGIFIFLIFGTSA